MPFESPKKLLTFTGNSRMVAGTGMRPLYQITFGAQECWLTPTSFRLLLQLGIRRRQLADHSFSRESTGWMHANELNSGGLMSSPYITRLRQELAKSGISPTLIESDGANHYRLRIIKSLVKLDYDSLLSDKIDENLKVRLLLTRQFDDGKNQTSVGKKR